MTPQTPQGAALSDADIEHPIAKKMRERFEAQYGELSDVMRACNAWRVTVENYRDGFNHLREQPITESDVDTAEREMLEAVRLAADRRLTAEQGGADDYGSKDFGYTFAGIQITEGDKRLMAMLVRAFGSDHPAVNDLTALLFRAALTTQPQAEPRTWREAVLKHITDPARAAQILSIPDDATGEEARALLATPTAQPQAEPAAWQERQARRLNRKTGEVTEWSRWHECAPRQATDPRAFTDPDDLIPREWRPLFATPTAPTEPT